MTTSNPPLTKPFMRRRHVARLRTGFRTTPFALKACGTKEGDAEFQKHSARMAELLTVLVEADTEADEA